MRAVGFLSSLAAIVAAMMFGSSAMLFINAPSAIIVAAVGFGVVVHAHGFDGLGLLFEATFSQVSPDTAGQAAEAARTASRSFTGAGWIGLIIGCVQMLANMNDPTQIGPAMAVALLTVFYAQLCAVLLWLPAERQAAAAAAVAA